MKIQNPENSLFAFIDYSGRKMPQKEFENSTFENCNFSDSDISNISFVDCGFSNCNFSNSKIRNTSFKDVKFRKSKLLGLNFFECNSFLLLLDFDDCYISLSSFYKMKLKNILFKNCILKEVDYTETELTGAKFENCDLNRSIFSNSILEKADFRTAFNYSIDPELNKIKRAKFTLPGVLGLLARYNIEIE